MHKAAVILAMALSVSSASVGGTDRPAVVPRPAAHPARIMSITECTDQIVLALLPPQRITSVTWLSRDPQSSQMARAALKVGINHGFAEEVMRERPDLVVAGTFTSTATRQMLKRLGWPLIEIGDDSTIEEIRANTRLIAHAVGASARGEMLLARMDREIADLARRREPPLRVAAWDGSGFSAQKGTLYDAVLTMAGAVNIAADPAIARNGIPSTELLLAAAPTLLVRGGGRDDRDAVRANVAQSPIVRRFWGKDRTVSIRQAYYLCGTPFVAGEASRLRKKLRAAAAIVRTPLPFSPRRVR